MKIRVESWTFLSPRSPPGKVPIQEIQTNSRGAISTKSPRLSEFTWVICRTLPGQQIVEIISSHVKVADSHVSIFPLVVNYASLDFSLEYWTWTQLVNKRIWYSKGMRAPSAPNNHPCAWNCSQPSQT